MANLFSNPSLVGLILQAAGVLMIAVLCLMLTRTIRRPPLVPWTAAWISLFIALSTLLCAFRVPTLAFVLHPVYMFLEYVFAYLVFAGSREYTTGRPVGRGDLPTVLLLLAPAVVLPMLARWQFNVLFAVHSMIYAYLLLLGWRQMRLARRRERSASGVLVTQAALLLLAVAHFAYGPLFAMAEVGWIPGEPAFLAYWPFFDSLLLTMLGFGMVMVSTGEVQSDLEIARDSLAGVARTDHLTSAFNRYAFHTLLERDLSGTAVIADIDNLKSINDQYGHSAGDAAIRAVATAIRGCIRADDLLFRWGGDEFLVLLLNVSELDARQRLSVVNEQLRAVRMPLGDAEVMVSVSMGFASFDSGESLDEVIRVADSAMYGTKRAGIEST